MAQENFDAIVVGSGISGGWAAKELTERGLRVLLLERGKNVEHQKDYPNARKGFWEYPYRAGRTRAMVDAYPVLRRDYPLNEKNLDWWVNERESPYTEVKRFDWFRGYQVGMTVKRSASAGATRCHITCVCGKPCSRTSGGPAPPVRANSRPMPMSIQRESKPGKRSARSSVMERKIVRE